MIRRQVMLLGILFPLAACAVGRGMQTVQVLSDLAAGTLPAGVTREAAPFAAGSRRHDADLYHPTGWRPGPALVLVPGASPQGRDDPRLVAFAGTLAKAGFRVLVPEIPALRRMTLSAADADIIADALRHLADSQQAGEGRFLGLVAVSYAVGPAMLAAHRPGLAEDVDVLVGIGGYHDVEAVATWFTTGWHRVPADGTGGAGGPGAWQQGQPDSFGKWLFLRANAGRVREPSDRAVLAEIAERRLRDPDAGLTDLVPRLGAEGRAVLAFLTNRDPSLVPGLIAGLPAPVRAEMAALDLARRDFGAAGPHLILVHGRHDRIIPHGQSLALAAAMRGADGESRAELHLVDGIGHVDAGGMTLGDGLVLAEAVYSLLALRDEGR
ncbi:MAG: hypothetical protein RIB84_17525 [Sneathiellaceae bacterium]